MRYFSRFLALMSILIIGLGLVAKPSASFAAPASQQASMRPGELIEVRLDPNFNPVRIPMPVDYSKRAPTATFTINYLPSGSGMWGDTCIAWPAQAQTAFSYAASVWASLLVSTVPITIDACWSNNLGVNVLGHGGAINLYRNFSGAPQTNTYYPVALANKYYGSDLNASARDIYIAYNSTATWYYGTDGSTLPSTIDLVSVAMHEMAHGLGFTGWMKIDDGSSVNGTECDGISGNGCWGYSNGVPTGYPMIYDRFTQDGSSNGLINTAIYPNPSAGLGTALKNGAVYFSGTNANAANGGGRVPLYAPSIWSSGSSYAHLDYNTYSNTPNRLMVYMISSGASIHDPGPVAMGILKDIGWQFTNTVCYPLTTTISPSNGGSITPSATDCDARYSSGKAVTLMSNPSTDYTFTNWSGCDSISGTTCNVTMSITKSVTANFVPTNDDYNTAFFASDATYNHTQRIEGSTTAGTDPSLSCASSTQRYNSVWYRFTAPLDGALTVNTFTSSYDTVLAIWTGSPGAFASQGCNNDFAGHGLLSQVGPISATLGTTYFLQVTSNVSSPTSPVTLNLASTFIPTNGWPLFLPYIKK